MSAGSSSVPFPPSGRYISCVSESASALRAASGVAISKEAIHRLLSSPAFSSSFARLSRSHGLALPLNFPSVLSELNVVCVLSLLNMGSGYRVPLHVHTGRGAWDSIRALVLSLFITSSSEGNDLLSAKAMAALTADRVAELMRVPLHTEKPHGSLPGVVVGERGGPLLELAELVAATLNETGRILLAQGYPNLGSFVLEALREAERAGKTRGGGVDTDIVLEKLVKAIPAFQDMYIVGGRAVYIFKKALFLLYAISVRFSPKESSPPSGTTIPVPDVADLPVFSDNVLPSMLVHLGIIDVSSATSSSLRTSFRPAQNLDSLLKVPAAPADGGGAPTTGKSQQRKDPPKEGPVLNEEDAVVLRASAIDACQQIVDEAHKEDSEWLRNLTLPELDLWLWAGAKDRADYRSLERFAQRNTVFF